MTRAASARTEENRSVILRGLAKDPDVSIGVIAEALDKMTPDERRAEAGGLNRDEQRLLYHKAAAAPGLTIADFVPSDVAPVTEVIHYGRNTLPLPRKHRYFQKRFCRPKDGSDRAFGYNESPSRWLIGPGYFVAVPTAGNRAWESRGSVVIDYFQVPDGDVAPGWPAVVPNTKGLQVLVYNKTRDFMRRVSSHVTIGAAYKKESSLDHYFMLCRA